MVDKHLEILKHSEFKELGSSSAENDLQHCESQPDMSASEPVVLSKSQKAQIERNRQRALLVREERNRKRSGFSAAIQTSPQK